jgi:hypothetical protein
MQTNLRSLGAEGGVIVVSDGGRLIFFILDEPEEEELAEVVGDSRLLAIFS